MRNKILLIIASILIGFSACDKDDFTDSTVVTTSQPVVALEFAQSSYVFAIGAGDILKTIPDTIAIAVDSLYGFESGFGGKTGKDSVYILKSGIIGGWPDTTEVGAYSLQFESPLNTINYKVPFSINVVVAGPIDNPGPTDISGTYKRTSNNFPITISKIFDGVYLIQNLGGAGVTPHPFLLYNYKSSAGNDSLAFPTQPNECGSATKLVAPSAPDGLTSADYDKLSPAIISLSPLTLSWKIFTFGDTNPGTSTTSSVCTWGNVAVRTFVKQ
jgi:hypothetical protein